MLAALRRFFAKDRPSPFYPLLPAVDDNGQSSIPGMYLLDDVAGRPLIKIGLNDGYDIGNRLADDLGDSPTGSADFDVVVVGAGVAGMGTAMRLHERGLRCLAIDAGRTFQTLRNFTKGKMLFAEPLDMPLKGSIPYEEGDTDAILARFDATIAAADLDVREYTKVTDVKRDPAGFHIVTERGEITARRVVLSIGKSGNPRKAGVPGELEHAAKISHFLKDPALHRDQDILIYGSGDVAAEAALALCAHNRVTMATIDETFVFSKKRNVDALHAQRDAGRPTPLLSGK